MITAGELAAMVGAMVDLKPVGRERWRGLCPFHAEKTPSFHIYVGRRGEGRFHCFGCSEDGDGGDWARKVEGKRLAFRPDPHIREAQQQRRRRERMLQIFLDRYPDTPVPPWL